VCECPVSPPPLPSGRFSSEFSVPERPDHKINNDYICLAYFTSQESGQEWAGGWLGGLNDIWWHTPIGWQVRWCSSTAPPHPSVESVKRQKPRDGKAVKWRGSSSTTSQKPLRKEPMPMPTSEQQGGLDMASLWQENGMKCTSVFLLHHGGKHTIDGPKPLRQLLRIIVSTQ